MTRHVANGKNYVGPDAAVLIEIRFEQTHNGKKVRSEVSWAEPKLKKLGLALPTTSAATGNVGCGGRLVEMVPEWMSVIVRIGLMGWYCAPTWSPAVQGLAAAFGAAPSEEHLCATTETKAG